MAVLSILAGVSFMMDPFCDNPDDSRWHAYLDEVNVFALQHGARFSLTQTKRVKPGQAHLDPRFVRSRFLTPYFKQFILKAEA